LFLYRLGAVTIIHLLIYLLTNLHVIVEYAMQNRTTMEGRSKMLLELETETGV